MPRPEHQPTDETRRLVKAMAAYGAKQDAIATELAIHQETLRKHYRQELDTSAEKANMRVGQTLYSLASGEAMAKGATWADVSRAAMFWAKTRMGWRETDRLEMTGKDGEPMKIHVIIGGDEPNNA